MLNRGRSFILTFGMMFAPMAIADAQETQNASASLGNHLPVHAFDQLQAMHSEDSPLLVLQGEMDDLIGPDGGGACPLAAGLTAIQSLRLMAGMAAEHQPHRLALRLLNENPELLKGRISNDRFVEVIEYLGKSLDEKPLAIQVISSPTSTHSKGGEHWSVSKGPELSVNPRELKILAYTVTLPNGTVRGRHFVLLQESDGNQISFVNPTKPTKDYKFVVEYRGDRTNPRRQVFFHSPAGLDTSNQTYELNTIFTIRLIVETSDADLGRVMSVDQAKARIDELADRLRKENELTNPTAWRKLGASFGLPGLDLPEDVGGSSWSTVDMIEVFRHAGKLNLNLRDVVGAAHGRPLAKSNSEYAKQVLTDIVSGKAYVAVAITEPVAGSDMRAMESRATKAGDGFALSGQKLWNARLRQATHVVLYTLASNGKPGARTAFLLPIDHPGLQIVDEYAHGLTGNSFGGLKFNDMHVGPEYLLGQDGDGGDIFNEHFTYWRLMQSAAAIGCGEAALQQMADRIKERHAYGGPIGRFTHLQQPIGEFTTKLRMAMALSRQAAELIDQGNYEAASPLVNGIKAEGVEIALAASDAAMRAHGALGYSRQVDLGDRVRDLMGLRIADGTTDVMRMQVVRELYGDEYWDMAIRGDKSTTQESESVRQPVEPVKQ
ncbi:MAG: acyl-CoA/acyl-ACP dehydrogenase [Planctomycetes bacterium]|nr:acyl-CoA/acyl-ACP dehydrogenase [Planctomycetota bacterium]